MPKRKNSTPVKSRNTNENWSLVTVEKPTQNVDNESENDNNETSMKKLKVEQPIPIFKYNKKEEQYLLKTIRIGSTNNVVPDNWRKCKVICSDLFLKINFDNNDNVIIQLSCYYDINFLKDILSIKLFKFNFTVNLESQMVDLSIYLFKPQDLNYTKKVSEIVRKVMADFFNLDMSNVYEDINIKIHENIDDIYEAVKQYREGKINKNDETNLQHNNLLPTLRPYQYDAVKWMIQRENNLNTDSLHLLYMNITLSTGTIIYYNKYTGYIHLNKPEVKYINTGGILADEMGLGKTVEVLALILNNPRKDVLCIEENPDELLNEESKSDDPNATIPKIDTQLKYVRPKTKIKKDSKPKMVEKKNMSIAKKAAQQWYENKLAEMAVFQKKNIRSKEEVQCICGDFGENGIIACKDCNKKQHSQCMGYKKTDDNYICPQCWLNKPLVKSRATLIVSPLAICRQWSVEIQRHIRKNGLKVLEYKGIHNAGMIYPTDLASYDIVITTYSTLQSEIKFTNEEQNSISLRYAKRYNIPNTPLVFVDWWRLCLDEAQYVECHTGLVSEMARQLHAQFRWAVTGTPIQRHLVDLYGLIDYLQLEPYNDLKTWNYALYYPYLHECKENMLEFLSTVMWRSAKANVLGQINIPTQTIQEHWLEFSAVEKFFYSREHESCAKDFLAKLVKFDTFDITLKSIDRKTLNFILTPLLSLRQACTHPYAVRGRYLTSKRQVNSMEELLEVLIKKNVNDCEESLRAIIASLNGMAGILLLQERRLEAVEKYRDALTYMSKYDNTSFMKIDKLQKIHTLYNLNEILMSKGQPIPPTLRDEKLKEECDTYQRKYMDKYISETKTALEELTTATKLVKKHEKALTLEEGGWFPEVIDWLTDENLEGEICRKIENIPLETRNKQKYQNIGSSRDIILLIVTWVDKVIKQLKTIRNLLQKIETAFMSQGNYISEEIVDKAMECHLRPAKSKKSKDNCMCCVLDSNLKKYECMIFLMNTKIEKNHSNKGSWKPCFEDEVIKIVYNFAKQRGAPIEIMKDGLMHIKLCDARKKEFKALRKLYMHFDAQVSAQDELNICKIRFRLRNPEEPVKVIKKKIQILENLNYETENKYEFINVLNEFELDINYDNLDAEKISNEEQLKKLIGTHSYLETLRKQQYAGQNPDPCPICNVQLQDSWSILHCGHCYCLDCIHQLLEQYRTSVNHVQCSVCRKKQLCNDISYIKMKGSNENTIDDVTIKGSYSTKIHAVIYTVLKLKQSDPDVKILIFSLWNNVLKAISDAFHNNDVKHEYVLSTNLQDKLQRFKDERLHVTALLLPVRLGANGLNLTEATHVFLVEPLMNPGEELQAIGRVHRIGQTKPTFVHRFVIKHTMEENIHNAMATNSQQWEDNNLTLNELRNLFTESIVSNKETEQII